MTANALRRSADSVIPNITCPRCGKHMRLATIEPEGSDDHDRMGFDCECGFDYHLSDRARAERLFKTREPQKADAPKATAR